IEKTTNRRDMTGPEGLAEQRTAELWQLLHTELLAYVRRSLDPDTAEDVVQIAFARAHRFLSSQDLPDNPRAWLYRIARNLVVDTQRQLTAQRTLAKAVANEPSPQAGEDSIDEGARAIVAQTLPMCIQRLAPPYRDALQMTELDGLTQADAAARAGISISGMKSRVQRGRKQVLESLRRCCAFTLDGRGRVMDCERRGEDERCCPEVHHRSAGRPRGSGE
ncbi:MAG: sigma-70 family RNA polymerase sigma factor, partial [Myxococcota bacterium]